MHSKAVSSIPFPNMSDTSAAGDQDVRRRTLTRTVLRDKIDCAWDDAKIEAALRRRVDLGGLLAVVQRVSKLDRRLAEEVLRCIAPVRVAQSEVYFLPRVLTLVPRGRMRKRSSFPPSRTATSPSFNCSQSRLCGRTNGTLLQFPSFFLKALAIIEARFLLKVTRSEV